MNDLHERLRYFAVAVYQISGNLRKDRLLTDNINQLIRASASPGANYGEANYWLQYFNQILPETKDLTSYFSFYDLAEKIGLAVGTLTFGLIEGYLNIRTSILALVIFFVIGLIILLFIPKTSNLQHETTN